LRRNLKQLKCGVRETLLEVEAQAELDLTRVVSLRGDHAKSLRTLEADHRVKEIDVVEKVEEFGGEAERGAFAGQLELFGEGQIHVPIFQTAQRSAARRGIDAGLNGAKLV
jgi:hypothetical protein